MAFVSGFGAAVILKRPTGNHEFCTAGWTMTETTESTKRSHAGTGGVKYSVPGDVEYSGTFDLPFDDETTLEQLGFVAGTYATLRMKLGGASKYYEIVALVKSRQIKAANDPIGAVMWSVTWEGAGPLVGPKN